MKRLFQIGFGSLGALALILVAWCATLPEGGVRLANELDDYAIQSMEEHSILEPGEEVLAYYDVTILANGSEAAIVTDRRVVYLKDGRITSIALPDIVAIEHRYESLIGDIIEVEGISGTFMKIEIAPLNLGETFLRVLRSQSERVKEEL